jgi:DNA-binding XRE family transcriptional regulator
MNITNTAQNLAAIFKATRKFNRLQQTEFAAILEVTQGTISKIEAGNMHPELGLWFKLLRAFNISDPYCFTYGGLEFNREVFKNLKESGSSLLPTFDFSDDKTIFEVRSIRPIIDFLLKNHAKAFEAFLKKHKIGSEVFYILNHPLPLDFAEAFFVFLQENKINEKSIALLNLNFGSSYGEQSSSLLNSNSPEIFFEALDKEKDALVKYKLNASNNSYTVSLSKKKAALLDSISSKSLMIDYNLLYPYHFLKSTKQCMITAPVITEVKKNVEWQVSYAS